MVAIERALIESVLFAQWRHYLQMKRTLAWTALFSNMPIRDCLNHFGRIGNHIGIAIKQLVLLKNDTCIH